jgi:type I restriction enzyme S subunit
MKKDNSGNIEEQGLVDNKELPEGWQELPLLELCELIRGVSYIKGEESHTSGKGFVPLLRANNIDRELKFDDIYYIPERYVKSKQFLRQGDALFAMSSGSKSVVGKAATVKQPFNGTFGAFCGVLRPSNHVDWKFFGYFFQTKYYRDRISEASAGVNINNLKREYFEAINFPFPPFAEQQRIVTSVEALLAHVTAAGDRLNRVQLFMKKFRQAVLAAACSGRLTGGWREKNSQIPSSTEALDAFFRSVRDDSSLKIIQKRTKDTETNPDFEWPFEIPESWCWAKLEKLAAIEKNSITDGPFGSNLKTEHYSQSGPRVIRLQNIGDGSFIDIKTHISQSHFDTLHKHEIFPGDIAIGLLGDPIPRSCIIPDGIGPAIVKADCTRFKPNPELALTKFLSYAINVPELRSQATESVHGVARPRLNLTQIKNFSVPLPPLAEQHEIVRRVGMLFERADAFDQEVAAASWRCERLTQTVLAKAFRGDLVPAGMVEGKA